MIHFSRLRISGFKSFVDKTELDIGQGLTGIVGPNGCGKSNLVEALRWAMGESSAKKMRGGGMEDVIFSGTEKRPARNFSEVAIMLDNSEGTAPPAYNNSEEIEVIRRITRDQGSAYRVNGRPARARDVQMLFADSMSGANSPSIVSQGKVATIINAKPLERRLILEESAGIAGLHARRHEAELRLKQAEQNLQRLEDMTGTMESRLQALKRQARQAQKYKNLNTEIRRLDQVIAYVEWYTAKRRLQELEREFGVHDSEVAEHMATVSQLNKTYLTQTEDLPKLREAETKASAALQNHKINLQRMEEQEQAASKALQETRDQLAQISDDIALSESSLAEYETNQQRIEEEQVTLQKELDQNVDTIAAREVALKDIETGVTDREERYNQLMSDTAAANARRDSLKGQINDDDKRLARLQSRQDEQTARHENLTQEQQNQVSLEELQARLDQLQQDIDSRTNKLETLSQEKDELTTQLEDTRQKRRDQELEISKAENEISTLRDFIETFSEDDYDPVLNEITAEQGFEAALSRALGDNLQASLNEDAPVYWQKRALDNLSPLPDDIKAMNTVVTAPDALAPALSQIGIVETVDQGQETFAQLQPGQALVSKDGAYWRWDGLCMQAEAADRQALFLRQKNTLQELETAVPAKQEQLDILSATLAEQEEKRETLEQDLKDNREALKTLEQDRLAQEKDVNAKQARADSLQRELETLNATLEELNQDIQALAEQKAAQEEELDALNDSAGADREEALQNLKDELTQKRQKLQTAISELDQSKQRQNSRNARLRAIADERINLQNRIIKGRKHLSALKDRQTASQEKLDELESKPVDLQDDREEIMNKIEELETSRKNAADNLAAQESQSQETSRGLKDAENALSNAREERARAQAMVGSAQERVEASENLITEKFECTPGALSHQIEPPEDYSNETLERFKEERQKALRDREALGPVNLQAEIEAQELESEMGGLLSEKQDLEAAIDELRGGIRELNSEARERLSEAFERVNAHFRILFERLFGGGHAHLSLIESDDPLQAGLEIFAQPPGKTLQGLSLMSGGEQTLSSIALIFAMFLTNPAPICVLDEIDAPLDDANVDRVCDLLEEISEQTKTRFLVVTHHRLTMARMDRIYGVTMAEKGVSQLVSLDMQQSFSFLEEAA